MTRNNEAQAFNSNENPGWEAVASSLGSNISSRHMGFAERANRYHTPGASNMVIPAFGAAALARCIARRTNWSGALSERVGGLSRRISRWKRPTDPSARPISMFWLDRKRKGRVGLEEHTDTPYAGFMQDAPTAQESVTTRIGVQRQQASGIDNRFSDGMAMRYVSIHGDIHSPSIHETGEQRQQDITIPRVPSETTAAQHGAVHGGIRNTSVQRSGAKLQRAYQRGMEGSKATALGKASRFAAAHLEKIQRGPAAGSIFELRSAPRALSSPVTMFDASPVSPREAAVTPGSGIRLQQEQPATLEGRSLPFNRHHIASGDTATARQRKVALDISRGKEGHAVAPGHLGSGTPAPVPPAKESGNVRVSTLGQYQPDSMASDADMSKTRSPVILRQLGGLAFRKTRGLLLGTAAARVTGLRSIRLPLHRAISRSVQETEPKKAMETELTSSQLTPVSSGAGAAPADGLLATKRAEDQSPRYSATKPTMRKRLRMSVPHLGRPAQEQPHRVELPRIDEVAQATGDQAPVPSTPTGQVKMPRKSRLKMPFLINRAADGEEVRRIVTPDRAAPPRIPGTLSPAHWTGAPESPPSTVGTGTRGAQPEGRYDRAEDKPFIEAISRKYRPATSLHRGEALKQPTSIRHFSGQALPVTSRWPEPGPLGRLVDSGVSTGPEGDDKGSPASSGATRHLDSIVNSGGMVQRRTAKNFGGDVSLPTMPIHNELSIMQASMNTANRDFTASIYPQVRDSRRELVLAAVPQRPTIDRLSSTVSLAPVQAAGGAAAGDTGPAQGGESSGGNADSDALAREVYTIIKRRLQIEKERIGY